MTEDERKLCPTCKLPLVPQQGSSPPASVCEAGHRLVEVALEGHALGTASLNLYATGNQRIGEVPAREEVRYQQGGDLQGSFKLDRTDAHPKIEQTAEHSYRSTREISEQEEVEAVMRLLPQYNSVHKSNYESPMKYKRQDSAIDVVAKDSSTGSRLSLQVRKADARPWRSLARSGRHDIQQSEREIHEELWRGIDQ